MPASSSARRDPQVCPACGEPECFLHLSETHLDQQEGTMNWLVILAVVLITLWILAEVLGFVIGAALHLLWIAALVLLAIWLFRKMGARV
jgi:hypothetical protein